MLFDQYIEPCCAYCRFGSNVGDGDVICLKKGIVNYDDACLRFDYEPTKRIPVPVATQNVKTPQKFNMSIIENTQDLD